jgi:ComF family protein
VTGLVDVLFPPRCPACGANGWPLCRDCTTGVGVITPPICRRCGRPTETPVEGCPDCPPPAIDRVRTPFLYDGPVSKAIKAMKFSGWHALARHLGDAMAILVDRPIDAVTWVPLSRRRRARRGFDQAEVLARVVARRAGLPGVRLLRRVRDTRAQARLVGSDRRSALRGAFAAVGTPSPRVLLVDDVLTTGSTASACAEALRSAGARSVAVLAAARSLNGPVPSRCYGVPDGPLERSAAPVIRLGGLAPGSVVARGILLR